MRNNLLLMLLLCSTHVFATSYKWVDENNHTHYSEQPPPNKKAKVLSSGSNVGTVPTSGVPASKTAVERAAEISKGKQPTKEATEKAALKQVYDNALKANCESARKNLASLNDGIRLVEIDANGERSFLSDEQRQQKSVKAQQDIQENCK